MFIKRFVLIVLTFVLLTAQSFAVSGSGLKEAFDEFHYAVSVEWDQKDKAFYNKQVDKLSEKIRELQAKGLTNTDLFNFVLSETKDESLKKELSILLVQLQINKLPQAEALKLVKERLEKTQSQGASWNGRGDTIIIGLVVVLVVAWTVAYVQCIRDPNHVTVCTEDYVCSSSYDSYYGYSDSCYWETSCGCSH